jgi:hypothetical protein
VDTNTPSSHATGPRQYPFLLRYTDAASGKYKDYSINVRLVKSGNYTPSVSNETECSFPSFPVILSSSLTTDKYVRLMGMAANEADDNFVVFGRMWNHTSADTANQNDGFIARYS